MKPPPSHVNLRKYQFPGAYKLLSSDLINIYSTKFPRFKGKIQEFTVVFAEKGFFCSNLLKVLPFPLEKPR